MSVIGSNALAGASGQGGGGYVIEKSLRFNSGDNANLSRTPSSSSNRNKYTWSCWVKRCQLGGTTHYLFSAQDGSNVDFLGFEADSIMWYNAYSGGVTSTDKFRDTSAWYHVVFSVDSTQATAADRVKIYVNNRQITSFSSSLYPSQNRDFAINHTVAHSIGHYGGSYSSNFYLAEVHFVDGQVLTPADFGAFDSNGVWQAAEYTGTYGTNGFHLDFADGSNLGNDAAGSNNWTANNLTGVAAAVSLSDVTIQSGGSIISGGDPGNWFDGDKDTYAYANLNDNTNYIQWAPSGGYTTPGYIWIQGGDGNGNGLDSLTVTINGSTVSHSSVVSNETYSAAAYGWGKWFKYAVSGNTLNSVRVTGAFTLLRQISTVADPTHSVLGISDDNDVPVLLVGAPGDLDLLFDSPTNGDATADTGAGGEVSGNYCTMNAVHSTATLENGNLDVKAIVGHSNNYGTFGMSSGKWYWEVYRDAYSANSGAIGFHGSASANKKLGTTWPSPGSYTDQHTVYFNGASSALLYNGQSGASFTFTGSSTPALPTGWVSDAGYYMFCVDMDNQKAWIGKDGVWWGWNGSAYTTTGGDPANGTNPTFVLDANDTYFPFNGAYDTATGNYTYVHNFGQRSWKYAAPSGFKALCTANLPTPTIADGSDYFDAVLYSGTGNAQSITGLGFSPDLVWTKNRGADASHAVYDSVRGAGELIRTNETSAEVTVSSRFTSFNSDGFSIGGTSTENNASSNTYVSWAWDAGTSNTSISAGGLNSLLYDQSQTWSTYGTFDNNWSNSDYHWDDVFNTTLTNNGAGSLYVDGTTKDTWNLSSSYAVSNTIKVYTQNPTEITINEGLSDETISTSSGTGLHYHSFSFTGNVESVGVRHASGGGIYFMGIWFDGKQLVDDTETVANVPSIASTVRANPSAGFSIVSFTAGSTSSYTVGHGLNAKPHFMIFKDRDTAGQPWTIYHDSLGSSKYLQFSTASEASASWGGDPTSSIFYAGTTFFVNGADIIAYCFAPVSGYSSFGKYTGNGNADGPFVHTGFRPAFVIIKGIDGGDHWYVYDTKRLGYNPANEQLAANISDLEYAASSYTSLDFVSNGFKIRGTVAGRNTNNVNYLYAAFAENPFQANGGLAR